MNSMCQARAQRAIQGGWSLLVFLSVIEAELGHIEQRCERYLRYVLSNRGHILNEQDVQTIQAVRWNLPQTLTVFWSLNLSDMASPISNTNPSGVGCSGLPAEGSHLDRERLDTRVKKLSYGYRTLIDELCGALACCNKALTAKNILTYLPYTERQRVFATKITVQRMILGWRAGNVLPSDWFCMTHRPKPFKPTAAHHGRGLSPANDGGANEDRDRRSSRTLEPARCE